MLKLMNIYTGKRIFQVQVFMRELTCKTTFLNSEQKHLTFRVHNVMSETINNIVNFQ